MNLSSNKDDMQNTLNALDGNKVKHQVVDLGELSLAQSIANKYTKEVASTILPVWRPPDASTFTQKMSLDVIAEMFQNSFMSQSELGTQLQTHQQKTEKHTFEQMQIPLDYAQLLSIQQQKLDTNLVALIRMIFEQNLYSVQMLRIQELVFRSIKITDYVYGVVPAYLLDRKHEDFHFPLPPFDPRTKLVALITLINSKIPKKPEIMLFLMSNRVCDFIEVVFWLTHSMVFTPLDGTASFKDQFASMRLKQLTIFDQPNPEQVVEEAAQKQDDQEIQNLLHLHDTARIVEEKQVKNDTISYPLPYNGEENLKYKGKYFLPEHLDIVKNDINTHEYLANRLADCYAAMQRAWTGCTSNTKVVIQEIIPYFVCNTVIKMLKRSFPQYIHVFSQRFQTNIYYNVLFAITGILPYQDIIQNTILKYFPENNDASVQTLQQYIPNASPLMGGDILELDLSTVLTGIYTNRINFLNNDKNLPNRQMIPQLLQENTMMSLNSVKDASELHPIEFDFILFKELISTETKFDVDFFSKRNISKQKTKNINLAQSVIDSMSNQTKSFCKGDIALSLIQPMEKEASRVATHTVQRTKLRDLDKVEELSGHEEHQVFLEQQQQKVIRALGLFELDKTIEPETKYTKTDYTTLTFLRPEDVEAIKEMGVQIQTQKSQNDQNTSITGEQFVQQSVALNSTFIIRVEPKLRKFKQQEVQFSQVIQSEIVTNNDIVFDMYDASYQEMMAKAMKEGEETSKIIQGEGKKTHSHGILPSMKNIQIKNAMEKINNIQVRENQQDYVHPLKISGQKFNTSRVTPLLLRYLEMSHAPAPAQFITSISEFSIPDPKKFQTNFAKRMDNFRNGVSNSGLSGHSTGTRHVNTVMRTRSDNWLGKPVNIDEQLSKNNFLDQYYQRVALLKQKSQIEKEEHKEQMAQLEVRRQMFMTPQLCGHATRQQGLAKTISTPAPKKRTIEAVRQEIVVDMQVNLYDKIQTLNRVENLGRTQIVREQKREEKDGAKRVAKSELEVSQVKSWMEANGYGDPKK